MRRLFIFASNLALRFPLLFEVALVLAVPFFLLATRVTGQPRKTSRRRVLLRGRLHEFRIRVLERSIEMLSAQGRSNDMRKLRGRMLRHTLNLAGTNFMVTGNLRLAAKSLEGALSLTPVASKRAIHDRRVLGATYFMLGEIEKAHRAFRLANYGRKLLHDMGACSPRVKYLGPAWFAAIGHVAMLDFYFKRRLLGWGDPTVETVLLDRPIDSIPGETMVLDYCQYGLRPIYPMSIVKGYDRHKGGNAIAWNGLSDNDRFALMDDFWEYDVPGSETVTYTHVAARIQQQWEAAGRAPLLSLNSRKREALKRLLREMGVPEGQWYVCLHVREAGFHAKWNAVYPTVRDANVEDYIPAIATIVKRGGFVIRVGDSSMKKLPPMEGVYDYAHSDLKSVQGDILLPASCRFFVGTNSGYATVPGIYGVPNVLTNWVPIALPLWFGRDLMIPKLFLDRRTERPVDFHTMFSTTLGSIQNVDDIPEHIDVRPNSPAEINEVVVEMLDRLENQWAYTVEDNELQERYQGLAEKHGSYRGSRLGRDFVRKYADLIKAGDEPTDVGTTSPVLSDDNTSNRRAAVPGPR